MSDPFAAALSVLFSSPIGVDASYAVGGGPALLLRVIRSQPDAEAPFGQGRVIERTNLFEIQRSDVANPQAGAVLTIGIEQFELAGDPRLDTEGLTWTIGGFPTP